MRRVCLMYHDVHAADAPAADIPPGAARYHISAEAFRRHLEIVAPSCRQGTVELTFDDGWRGSLTTGVECLVDAGLRAAFFVTSDFVGKRHYADPALLRDAHSAGMEIGTHGATHRLLADLPPPEIEAELRSSKAFLEDVLGAEVTAGSVPGGAWSPVVSETAGRVGYASLYTSRPGVNGERTDSLALCRVPIRRATTAAAVERFARHDVRLEVVRARVLAAPRTVLGRKRYARLRARLLR